MVVASGGETERIVWKAFWGKWGFSNDDHLPDSAVAVHPLFCHMADVAAVTRTVWEEVFTSHGRQALTDRLLLPDVETAISWIAFIAGSHDLGKATLAFGLQKSRAAGPLRAVGLRATLQSSEPDRRKQPHGLATAVLLPSLLKELGLDRRVALRIGDLLGGHHGIFPSRVEHNHIALQERNDPRSNDARRALLSALMDICGVRRNAVPAALDVSTALLFAGLISVADWIGSNTRFFPYAARLSTLGLEPRDPAAYASHAHQQAQRALRELGWTRHLSAAGQGTRVDEPFSASQARDGDARFSALFGGRHPLPMQRTTIDLAPALRDGGLAIIEAPMGEGKTEAALYLAAAWLERGRTRGAYFALPTQATSDQMFGRVRDFLRCLLPGSNVELQLLHGHAALSAEFARLREGGRTFDVENVHEGDRSSLPSADVVASEWFTYRKRGLLAPFGVGTVDQALLAALVTRHVFVRLFGLWAKAVIIDEVHAYDVYTSDLLKTLLTWLGALGAPVVLLSATLPSTKKRELTAAYAAGVGWPQQPVQERPYPRITWTSGSGTSVEQVETSERSRKTIRVRWMDRQRLENEGAAYPLGEALRTALNEGGCAAVICNTVASAQQTYRALRRYFGSGFAQAAGAIGLVTATDGEPELDLLHARLPFMERQRRELRARRRFGPPGSAVPTVTDDGSESSATTPVVRPSRSVLVATQVIEQSLDLDFDLMVSEMAPLDLLLQRTGRLHRHPQRRPRGLDDPTLWILEPEVDEGLPRFDSGSTYVYAEHVLLRSWLSLRRRMHVNEELTLAIPADVSDLIEEVYDDRHAPSGPPQVLQAWEQTLRKLEAEADRLAFEASVRRLDSPDADDSEPLARYTTNAVEEDDLELQPRFQALTRWGPPTVTVVVLYRQGAGHSLDSAGARAVNPDRKPRDLEEVKVLLRHSIPVSTRGLASHLLRAPVPRGWQESPLLSHCRPLVLDPIDRSTLIGRFRVRLDSNEGLVIEASDKDKEEPE